MLSQSNVCSFTEALFGNPEKRTSFEKGIQGESVAEAFYKKEGYHCLHKRHRTPFGEIDLILSQKNTLYFVEVKSRNFFSDAVKAVTVRQQNRIRKAANYFLAQTFNSWENVQLDVITVTKSGIHRISNCF